MKRIEKSNYRWMGMPIACTVTLVTIASCAPAQLTNSAPTGVAPQNSPVMLSEQPSNVFPNRRELLSLPAPMVGNAAVGEKEYLTAASALFPKSAKTNGRSCATCHIPAGNFTINPSEVQARLAANPTDPLFTGITADAGPDVTPAQQLDMLTTHALIRVNLGNPFFDPHYNNPADPSGMFNPQFVRLWRSVPTSVNAAFANTLTFNDPVTRASAKGMIMWDLREPSLEHQAVDATHGHAQEVGPLPASFGPNVGQFQREKAAVPAALFTASLKKPKLDPNHANPSDPFFGAPVFNPATFKKDFLLAANIAPGSLEERGMMAFAGTPEHPRCIVCHNQPGSLAGGTNVMRSARISETNALDLPMVSLRLKDANGMMHNVTTSDPGVAVTTGRFEDLNTFKVPQLRGLSKQGRFFHNNQETTLDGVLDHYHEAFPELFKDLKSKDRDAIAAFLNAI